MHKAISILGSTGSIGRQALEVVAAHPDNLRVVALACGNRWQVLLEQVELFRPKVVAVAGADEAQNLKTALNGFEPQPEILWGTEGLLAVAGHPESNLVLAAMSGASGIIPAMEAIRQGKDLALANKETLVAAGDLIMTLAAQKKVKILPVDSEHGAIWQCLLGRGLSPTAVPGISINGVERLILTASGGPFRQEPKDLGQITPQMALAHPNWNMGAKITIDSATWMNKGLEVIEAHHLFGLDYEQISVVIHPQSIVHSMVEYQDGSILAQMALPDMRLPIGFALSYPQRWTESWPRIKWNELKDLSFELPNWERFPLLGLAYAVGKAGGIWPTVMNAANEMAVNDFLNRKIAFTEIYPKVAKVVEQTPNYAQPALEDILEEDRRVRAEWPNK